jgi:hypothetical protein
MKNEIRKILRRGGRQTPEQIWDALKPPVENTQANRDVLAKALNQLADTEIVVANGKYGVV